MNAMPRCQNCGFKWSWQEVMMLSVKGKKKCSNCHKKQYISAKSNFWTTFLISTAFLLPMNFVHAYYEISWLWFFLAILIYITLVSLLMPFFYKLSNTHKRFGKTIE